MTGKGVIEVMKVTNGVSPVFNEIIMNSIFGPYLNYVQRLVLLISRLAAEMVAAEAGSVWLRRGDLLHRAVIINRPADLLHSFVMNINEGLTGEAVRECRPVISENACLDPRTTRREFAEREALVSAVSCPIMIGSICIGAITVFRKKRVLFSQRDVKVLSTFTDLVGLAVHHCGTSPGLFNQWQRYIQNVFELKFEHESDTQVGQSRKLMPIWVLESSLPKGINPITLARIRQFITNSNGPVSCETVSKEACVCPATARRYLSYLHEIGFLKQDVEYRKVGRPRYLYRSTETG